MGFLVTESLVVDSIVLRFRGIIALDNVSFTVEPGETFGLLGPNGAGKTSVFNCISGLYRPQGGEIRLGATRLTGLAAYRVAEAGIARTFQNIALFGGMTVLDNLLLGRHRLMRSGALADAWSFGRAMREETQHRFAVEQVIDLMELENVRHMPISVLPYGVQKRVELARALCMDPSLLLLDEPVAGMNVEEKEDMARFIVATRRTRPDLSIVLVEHDVNVVMDLSDRVGVLDFGRLIALDVPEGVRRNPAVIEAYLGTSDIDGHTA